MSKKKIARTRPTTPEEHVNRQARQSSRSTLTAAQLARQEVDRVFRSILEDEALVTALNDESPFETAYGQVLELLEQQHTPPVTDTTDNHETAIIGARAGYLVGVQVGLRLRGVS
jgi:hypothetical protein